MVYEAGRCGFVIWQHLTAQGVYFEVVAPSSISRPLGDRMKTDRHDVLTLANKIDLKVVCGADDVDEATRELVGALGGRRAQAAPQPMHRVGHWQAT